MSKRSWRPPPPIPATPPFKPEEVSGMAAGVVVAAALRNGGGGDDDDGDGDGDEDEL